MKIISFDTLPNTNDYLSELSKKGANTWTVIHTYNQTEGRGYVGNVWLQEEYQNLTFSILIKSDLKFSEMIYFNQWVANCLYLSLSKYSNDFEIKWPNDLILNNKKVCGVLIENSRRNGIMNSVVGIGININQTDFNHLPKASSLKNETGREYDIMAILNEIVDTFVMRFNDIEHRYFDQINTLYNQKLFRRDKISSFIINNENITGIIREATKDGTLVVEIDEKKYEFLHKQLELIF